MKNLKSILTALFIMAAAITSYAQTSAVNQALTAYYEVKNSLFAGNAAKAHDKSAELLTALKAVNASQLSTDEKTTWTSYAGKLEADAKFIAESNNLGQQREHFSTLSKNLFEVVKKVHPNQAAVYQQYCPMKKAYWLNEVATIQNPYYGSQMPTCGKVAEVITPSN